MKIATGTQNGAARHTKPRSKVRFTRSSNKLKTEPLNYRQQRGNLLRRCCWEDSSQPWRFQAGLRGAREPTRKKLFSHLSRFCVDNTQFRSRCDFTNFVGPYVGPKALRNRDAKIISVFLGRW